MYFMCSADVYTLDPSVCFTRYAIQVWSCHATSVARLNCRASEKQCHYADCAGARLSILSIYLELLSMLFMFTDSCGRMYWTSQHQYLDRNKLIVRGTIAYCHAFSTCPWCRIENPWACSASLLHMVCHTFLCILYDLQPWRGELPTGYQARVPKWC